MGNDNIPSSCFQLYTFRINPELKYRFRGEHHHYPASEIKIRMSTNLKEIYIFFNTSIIKHYVVF